jgi:DNA-binding HxlR family transcriptional regulator
MVADGGGSSPAWRPSSRRDGRTVEGLTAKVLNDCLRLLVSYGVLEKRSFPEVPPRVEYHFTSFGRKFAETFEILDALEEKLARARRTKDGKASP